VPEIPAATLVTPASAVAVAPASATATRTAPAKAAALRDYLSLIAQARRRASSHLSAWAAVWAKATGLPLNVMTRASDDHSLAVPITPAVVASGQQVAGAFTAAGLIPGARESSQFVDASFDATAGA
jgi:sulfonate transport system substrate-binding protein